jgi:pyruvate-formate lyase-activating enzyme
MAGRHSKAIEIGAKRALPAPVVKKGKSAKGSANNVKTNPPKKTPRGDSGEPWNPPREIPREPVNPREMPREQVNPREMPREQVNPREMPREQVNPREMPREPVAIFSSQEIEAAAANNVMDYGKGANAFRRRSIASSVDEPTMSRELILDVLRSSEAQEILSDVHASGMSKWMAREGSKLIDEIANAFAKGLQQHARNASEYKEACATKKKEVLSDAERMYIRHWILPKGAFPNLTDLKQFAEELKGLLDEDNEEEIRERLLAPNEELESILIALRKEPFIPSAWMKSIQHFRNEFFRNVKIYAATEFNLEGEKNPRSFSCEKGSKFNYGVLCLMGNPRFFTENHHQKLQRAIIASLPQSLPDSVKTLYSTSEVFFKSVLVNTVWMIRYAPEGQKLSENSVSRIRDERTINFPYGFSLKPLTASGLDAVESIDSEEESEAKDGVLDGDNASDEHARAPWNK